MKLREKEPFITAHLNSMRSSEMSDPCKLMFYESLKRAVIQEGEYLAFITA